MGALRKPLRAGTGAALLALAMTSSCVGDEEQGGTPPRPGDGGSRDAFVFGPGFEAGDGAACGALGRSDGCNACLSARCCSRMASCGATGACTALVECVRDCSDDAGACRADCVDAHGGGVPPYNNLVLCMGSSCRAECPFDTP